MTDLTFDEKEFIEAAKEAKAAADKAMKEATFMVSVEYTDTFGGEANYSWVRRAELELPCGISDTALMRRAKKAIGITGMRGRTYANGDHWEFRPYGCCTVLFVQTQY